MRFLRLPQLLRHPISRAYILGGFLYLRSFDVVFKHFKDIFLEPVRQNHYHYYFNNPKLVHHVFCSAPIYLFTFCVAFFSQFVWTNVVCLFYSVFSIPISCCYSFAKAIQKKGCCYSLQKQLFVYRKKKVSFSFVIIETNNVLWLLRRIYSIRGTMTEV